MDKNNTVVSLGFQVINMALDNNLTDNFAA